MPRRILPTAALALLLATPTGPAESQALLRAAEGNGAFLWFADLARRAGMAEALDASPVTVLAPTDAAFSRLPEATRKAIWDLSPEAAGRLVRAFVIPGTAMPSTAMPKRVRSEGGQDYVVRWDGARLTVSTEGPTTGGTATVVTGDVPAGRGMIDGLGTVLMPRGVSPALDEMAATVPAPATTPSGDKPSVAPLQGAPSSGTPRAAEPMAPAPPPEVAHATSPSPKPAPLPPSPPPASPPDAAQAPSPSPKPSQPPTPPSEVAQAPSASPEPSPPPPSPPPASTPDVAQVPSASPEPSPPPVAPVPRPSPMAKATAQPPAAAPATPVARVPTPVGTPVTAAEMRGWKVTSSDGKAAGAVDRIVIDLPSGRVTGLTLRFGGLFGLGAKRVTVPWGQVTPDVTRRTLGVTVPLSELRANLR